MEKCAKNAYRNLLLPARRWLQSGVAADAAASSDAAVAREKSWQLLMFVVLAVCFCFCFFFLLFSLASVNAFHRSAAFCNILWLLFSTALLLRLHFNTQNSKTLKKKI